MSRSLTLAVACAVFAVISYPAFSQESSQSSAQQQPPGLKPCDELPTGELSDEELARLVPEGSPGRVRIGWRTESQEECYGFNIYRADKEGGEFKKINKAIIPGEGSTNIPKSYCYEDTSVERGKTYFYYIEEISNQGVATKLQDTLGPDGKGTRAKVKTVAEERVWLRKKALGEPTTPTTPATATQEATTSTAAAVQPVKVQVRPMPKGSAAAPATPAEKNPLE